MDSQIIYPKWNRTALEIQKENVPNLRETELEKRLRRINFYKQLGVKNLEGVNYLLPPLQPNAETEEMYLMIRPLVKTLYLSKESTIGFIEAIYSRIYECRDNYLLISSTSTSRKNIS